MTSTIPFEKLKGRENFSTWKIGAKAHLISKGHWSFIFADTVASADLPKDERALAEIILLVDSTIYSHLEDCETAKEGWLALVNAFEDKGVVRKVSLLKQWISLKLSDCASMQDYVNQCLVLRSKVKSAGFKIDEEIAGSIMLCGLPDEFRPMVMSIEAKSGEITVDFVKNVLLQEVEFGESRASALAVKKKFIGKKKKVVKCFECEGPHYKNKCPNLKKTEKSDIVLFSSFMAQNSSNSDWFIDSGATAHMTWCESILENKSSPRVKKVTVANNQTLMIDSVGDVKQSVIKEQCLGEVTLKDVQFIPGICVNLLSVSKIVKNSDREVRFDKTGCKILDKNKKIIAMGTLINDMFKLNTVSRAYACSAISNQDNIVLWHRRLAHASVSKLNLLLNLKKQKKIECVICAKGKHARHAFNIPGQRAADLLDLVHSDVCGPMPVNSIGGSKYFVTFIDDHSRKVFVYTLKTKSEVFSKFVQFKTFVETQLNKKLKVLRSDNGTEFINNGFDKCGVENGFKHEKSAPYSAQQNGLAERMNRTIIEKVRCMLFEANMSKGFWAEAVHAAADIINILPNRTNANRSPDEVWFGKKPNIEMFRVFGCKAMVMIPKEKRRKLDVKSNECIFLRRADDAKAYRLYDRSIKKIVISRDVLFFENDVEMIDVGVEKKSIIQLPLSGEVGLVNDSGGESNDESITQEDAENGNDDELNESRTSNQSESTIGSGMSNFGTPEADTENDLDNTRLDPTFRTRAEIPNTTRRVYPLRKKKTDTGLLFHIAFIIGEPQSYNQAINCAEKDKWMVAMKEEYDSLIQNQTWILVEKPKNETIVDNKWVFKIKKNPDDSVDRYKARLVARGFTQEYGVNYFETFSPVVRFTSIRIILAIASDRNMHLKQFDIKTAFLNGDLSEDVYMEQPIGFADGSNKVCKLNKSLYGLKQASRCWNQKFKYFIQTFGFIQCKSDPCVFVSYKDNKLIILAIHVDDGLVVADDQKCINLVIGHLQDHFEVKAMDVGCFLGVQIEKKEDGAIFIHQSAYTQKVLSKFEMSNCNPVAMPSDPNQSIHKYEDSEKSSYPYRELIGSLMYLAIATRPDIAHAVGIVSRYLENPTVVHETAAKRILRYLKGTINHGIYFQKSESQTLIGFSDADYAGDLETRRSTSGFIFMINNSVISWSSERQKSVSLSTTESEYIAASNAIRELVWLRVFLNDLLPEKLNQVKFFMDNQSAIRLIKNPEFHKRTKHIDVRYHFIRERYEEELFVLNYISTEKMIADIFTKSLPSQRFKFLKSKMNVIEKPF